MTGFLTHRRMMIDCRLSIIDEESSKEEKKLEARSSKLKGKRKLTNYQEPTASFKKTTHLLNNSTTKQLNN